LREFSSRWVGCRLDLVNSVLFAATALVIFLLRDVVPTSYAGAALVCALQVCHYFRLRGYVMLGVCLFVILSVCLSVSSFTWKVLNGSSWKFYNGCMCGQGRTGSTSGTYPILYHEDTKTKKLQHYNSVDSTTTPVLFITDQCSE